MWGGFCPTFLSLHGYTTAVWVAFCPATNNVGTVAGACILVVTKLGKCPERQMGKTVNLLAMPS